MPEMIDASTLGAKLQNGDRILITCNICRHEGYVDLEKLAKRLPLETVLLAPKLKSLHSCPACLFAGRNAKDLGFTMVVGCAPSAPNGSANG